MTGPTLEVQAEAAKRWQRASALFDELADVEPEQRGERLLKVAGEDVQLADMVRELLASDQRGDERLDAPTALDCELPGQVSYKQNNAAHGFPPHVERLAQPDLLRGRAVKLSHAQSGTAEPEGPYGALLVRTGRGLQAITSSDISVRPAAVG